MVGVPWLCSHPAQVAWSSLPGCFKRPICGVGPLARRCGVRTQCASHRPSRSALQLDLLEQPERNRILQHRVKVAVDGGRVAVGRSRFKGTVQGSTCSPCLPISEPPRRLCATSALFCFQPAAICQPPALLPRLTARGPCPRANMAARSSRGTPTTPHRCCASCGECPAGSRYHRPARPLAAPLRV
jgi:hypothetical protein